MSQWEYLSENVSSKPKRDQYGNASHCNDPLDLEDYSKAEQRGTSKMTSRNGSNAVQPSEYNRV